MVDINQTKPKINAANTGSKPPKSRYHALKARAAIILRIIKLKPEKTIIILFMVFPRFE